MPIDNSHHLGQILLSFQPPGHGPPTVVLSLLGLTRMHGVHNYKVEGICLTSGQGGQRRCCESCHFVESWESTRAMMQMPETSGIAEARAVRAATRQRMAKCLMSDVGT